MVRRVHKRHKRFRCLGVFVYFFWAQPVLDGVVVASPIHGRYITLSSVLTQRTTRNNMYMRKEAIGGYDQSFSYTIVITVQCKHPNVTCDGIPTTVRRFH